jgi:hypothetical protein
MPRFPQKVAAALYGHAIGDAMGAPVEGWPADRIAGRFSGVRTFLPPTHGGDPAKGKGAGRVTDDTLMAEALIRAYMAAGTHLDAHGYEAYLVPEVAGIPEWQAEGRLWDRLWLPEKFPLIRLRHAHADPRTAGVGNCVNCGAAMWTWPVGAVCAGDPAAAYQEGAAVGLAHNYSFAVEHRGTAGRPGGPQVGRGPLRADDPRRRLLWPRLRLDRRHGRGALRGGDGPGAHPQAAPGRVRQGQPPPVCRPGPGVRGGHPEDRGGGPEALRRPRPNHTAKGLTAESAENAENGK